MINLNKISKILSTMLVSACTKNEQASLGAKDNTKT